jgi:tetratricopeptide (TPR) repeat protein
MRSSLVVLSISALLFASSACARSLAAEDVASQAHQLLLDGQANASEEQLKERVASKEIDAAAWFELARTEFYLMKLDDAQTSIGHALKRDPENVRYHYLAGQLAVYNAVLKYKSPETRGQFGELTRQWLQELKRTVELDPNFFEAQVALVNAYLQTPPDQGGDRQKAKEVVERLEKLSPIDGARGRSMLVTDVAETVSLWKKMVDQHPNEATARVELAKAYMRQKESAKAKEQIDAALEIDAKQREVLLDLFRYAAMDNQFGLAREALSRYLSSEPKLPVPLRATATFYLARLAKQENNTEEADKLLAAAKELDPHVWMTLRQPPAFLFD